MIWLNLFLRSKKSNLKKGSIDDTKNKRNSYEPNHQNKEKEGQSRFKSSFRRRLTYKESQELIELEKNIPKLEEKKESFIKW